MYHVHLLFDSDLVMTAYKENFRNTNDTLPTALKKIKSAPEKGMHIKRN